MPNQEKLRQIALALFCVLGIGIVYVYNTWSPSSYAHVLKNHFGYLGAKPDIGSPRPIRSDEWAVVTPLTQATINNNFERYNKTSLYGEDLRINYGLPVADWGLLFKPTMWLYGHVNAAYAYSFHWYCFLVLFVIGYAVLFKQFGAGARIALLLSLGLFFTGYSQFWWNEKGPLFAIFPWLLIPFFFNINFVCKLALLYYAAVFWLLTNFYPPIQISLAFVGLIVLLATQRQLFRFPQVVGLVGAAGLAAGTAALYLYDYLLETSTTLYPGGRHVMGGEVPWSLVFSWFLPAVNFTWNYDALTMNMSEIGTVGMFYFLSALFFLDFDNSGRLWRDPATRRVFVLLAVGFLMQLAWVLLPIPASIGMLLLWDHVQPSRMQFSCGLLLTLLVFYSAHTMGVVLTLSRFWPFAACVAFILCVNKTVPGWRHNIDLAFLPMLLIVCILFQYRKHLHHEVIIAVSVMFGAIVFGRFNPLQSAWPIFNSPPNEVTEYLHRLERDNDGVVAVAGFPGAIMNGAGFRSLSHVTPVPHMDFWRKNFPTLPASQLNQIFNRYSHIVPDVASSPRMLTADSVAVPLSHFGQMIAARSVSNIDSDSLPRAGFYSIETAVPEELIAFGWGAWKRDIAQHEIEVMSEPAPAGVPQFVPIVRPDLPLNTDYQVSMMNGFKLKIPWHGGKSLKCLSLIARDGADGGRMLLNNPPDLPHCKLSFSR